MHSVLVTALGKQPGSRFIAIGTAPALADTSGWWGRMLEQGTTSDQHVTIYRAAGRKVGMAEVRRAYPFGRNWPASGRLESFAAVGDTPDLRTWGKRDSVDDFYERCAKRLELITLPGRVPDLALVIAEAIARYGAPDVVVGDRYRVASLRDALAEAEVFAPLELRSLTWVQAGEDVKIRRHAANKEKSAACGVLHCG